MILTCFAFANVTKAVFLNYFFKERRYHASKVNKLYKCVPIV